MARTPLIVTLGKLNSVNVDGRGNADMWKYFGFAGEVPTEQNTLQK
jgi:hypothetical protein